MVLVALQTFFADALLTERAVLPARLRALITTYMEIFAREEGHHLIDNIFQEVEHFLLTRTHHDVFNTPNDTRRPRLAFARQLRIGGDGSHLVSRNLQFGDNRNEVIGSILHHLFDFLLRVEALVLRAFALDACRADLGQLRVLLDFDTPALVVSQMPVQAVDFEQRQNVDVSLHILHGHEMAARVEHDAAIAEARFVFDAHGSGRPRDAFHGRGTFNLGRQQLHERLHTIEKSLRFLSLDLHALGGNVERVALVIDIERFVERQRDVALVSHLDVVARGCFHLVREKFRDGFRLRAGRPESSALT